MGDVQIDKHFAWIVICNPHNVTKMTKFGVILEGRGIRVPGDGEADPIIGFMTTRVVEAKSPDEAIEIAKDLVIEDWVTGEPAQANTGLVPEISVDAVFRPSWFQVLFRRIPTNGYIFYSQE